MSWIMTKRGSQDNIITYEHYCDTFSDLSNIPSSQVTLGSTAVVINDEDNGLGIYMANSQKEWVPISTSIGGGSGGITLDLIHICSSEEYDSNTKVPTIEDAEVNKIYLVPNNSNGNNLFDEWIYADDAWEKIGGGNINIPVSDVQVNGTSIVDGSGVANVPIASNAAPGVVKIGGSYGMGVSGGTLYMDGASQTDIKAGSKSYRFAALDKQHLATFYGLAKAAGDTTQSQSNNSVGTYTDSAKTAIKFMLGVNVNDVQINGTSIVNQGVANVPIATDSTFGAVKLGAFGVTKVASGINKDKLCIECAGAGLIKTATDQYRPIVSSHQHESTFYGLAKAAGADMKDIASSTVGTYPDVQKAAIQNMLGVPSVNGSYPDMTVGNAEQLVATIGIEDSVPYNFRTAGGSVDIGDREVDKIVGGTVAWNQLAKVPASGNGYKTGWSHSSELSYSDDKVTSTSLVDGVDIRYDGIGTILANTKMLVFAELESSVDANVAFRSLSNTQSIAMIALSSGVKTQFSNVFSLSNNFAELQFMATTAVNDTLTLGNFEVFNLTQMFGSTIADYIYSLETATAGAGVAWFRKLFPKPYYAYNAGELMSVQTSAHKMVGFNAWDEEWINATMTSSGDLSTTESSATSRVATKNYIPVLAGCTYYVGLPGDTIARWAFYDADYNSLSSNVAYLSARAVTVPANAAYMRFATGSAYGGTYKNDICINLSWDGERNGEYEPYQAWEYPLDSDLVLRGIPKLDSGNNLYYDGDTYESDGMVTRQMVELEVTAVANVNTSTTGAKYGGVSISAYGEVATELTRNNFLSDKYQFTVAAPSDGGKWFRIIGQGLYIFDERFTDLATANSILASEKPKFVFEISTPTTETADPYQNPQIVEDFGTEEYVDTRDVAIPVGHDTTYRANLRAKLEMAPNSPDGDGDYIVRQANGQNEYVPLVESVSDVQVNGTSVVNQGVANVPVANTNKFGVIIVGPNASGLEIDSGGFLKVISASESLVKAGIDSRRTITPSVQHNAAFYGLAKAAGADMASSSNAVGTYTDAAKAAIQSMIGVGITDEVVSGTTPTITGVSNHRYHCGEVASISFTPSGAGICDVVFTSGTTPAVLTIPNTVKLPEWFDATSLEPSTIYEISVADGVYGVVTTWQV